jgi:hypothetical protein
MRNIKDMIELLAANETIGLEPILNAIVSVRNNADDLTFDTLSVELESKGLELKQPLDNENLDDYAFDIIDKIFLKRYIFTNYFLPKHIGLEHNEVVPFKLYLINKACGGTINDEMEKYVKDFRKEQK